MPESQQKSFVYQHVMTARCVAAFNQFISRGQLQYIYIGRIYIYISLQVRRLTPCKIAGLHNVLINVHPVQHDEPRTRPGYVQGNGHQSYKPKELVSALTVRTPIHKAIVPVNEGVSNTSPMVKTLLTQASTLHPYQHKITDCCHEAEI